MSDNWHRLSAATAEMRRAPVSSRNSVTFYLSPFQIPEAYRQTRDATGVAIEFRYADEGEPTREVTVRDGVTVRVGKVSSRIFCIRIPNTLIAAFVQQMASEQQAGRDVAIGAIRQLYTENAKDNHRVTAKLFESNMLDPATP